MPQSTTAKPCSTVTEKSFFFFFTEYKRKFVLSDHELISNRVSEVLDNH